MLARDYRSAPAEATGPLQRGRALLILALRNHPSDAGRDRYIPMRRPMRGPLRRFAAFYFLFLVLGCDSDRPQQGWQVSAAPRARRGNRARYVHKAPARTPLKLAFVCNNASGF